MLYTHDYDQAQEYATEAIKLLKSLNIPPSPENFELWYVFFSGQNVELRDTLSKLLKNNKKDITPERCRELYQVYLSDTRNSARIQKAGERIHQTIHSVSGAVQDVKSATTSYSGKLGGVSLQMEGLQSSTELKDLLSTVMADTQEMLTQNQKLEQELDKSTVVMEELQKDLERVRREALTDGLTGLANRKAFDAELKRVAEDAADSGASFCLLMMDIDHFKAFNDNYGHQVGDQVLRLVGKTLTDGVKGRDVTARYGGEEFAIILPDTKLQAAVTVANALRTAVATKEVINRNSGETLGRITMSVGAAEHLPSESLADLIERADAALYTAKHNGRNQVAAAPSSDKK